MSRFQDFQVELKAKPAKWLITGVAGFIGSNLLETLLRLDQNVVGLDNFITGNQGNLQTARSLVSASQWARFRFVEGDISELASCQEACKGADFVLHQAALGSVPRSMVDPLESHRSNVTGFLNMLVASRDAQVKRFVYASSSAVYGDEPELPKVEHRIGKPLSPYAATKAINEVYANAFARAYGFGSIGLRYFNVFGPRQDPDGAYAAVIPKWIAALIKREPIQINGDGQTSRDFCYIDNVVQANLLAAGCTKPDAINQAYNIALGEKTTLNDLFALIQTNLREKDASLPEQKPVYADFRPGDVRHSVADISKAQLLLDYTPTHGIREGLALAMNWYLQVVR
jgi:UDP-N-acetylglucosamine 4-epimerase